jgi:hypothetical protein
MPEPFADIFLDRRAETYLYNRQTEGECLLLGANRKRKTSPNRLNINKKTDS